MPDTRRHGGGKGAGLNRPCLNCVYPCTGGEVLHRKGPCCKSFCPCVGFEPVPVQSRHGALNQSVYVRLNGKGRGPA